MYMYTYIMYRYMYIYIYIYIYTFDDFEAVSRNARGNSICLFTFALGTQMRYTDTHTRMLRYSR